MRKTVFSIAFTLAVATLVVVGCDSESSTPETGLPPRGNADAAEAGETFDCTNRAAVDDRPACDQCVRRGCCKEVLECDKTEDCAALMKCIEGCNDDPFCVLVCNETHEEGSIVLRRVGTCASNKCKSECPPPELDGGFDGF